MVWGTPFTCLKAGDNNPRGPPRSPALPKTATGTASAKVTRKSSRSPKVPAPWKKEWNGQLKITISLDLLLDDVLDLYLYIYIHRYIYIYIYLCIYIYIYSYQIVWTYSSSQNSQITLGWLPYKWATTSWLNIWHNLRLIWRGDHWDLVNTKWGTQVTSSANKLQLRRFAGRVIISIRNMLEQETLVVKSKSGFAWLKPRIFAMEATKHGDHRSKHGDVTYN